MMVMVVLAVTINPSPSEKVPIRIPLVPALRMALLVIVNPLTGTVKLVQ